MNERKKEGEKFLFIFSVSRTKQRGDGGSVG
jgi:hypothetical protein